MKKYIGLIMVIVGIGLLVLALIFGFKKEESSSNPTPTPTPASTPISATISEGATFNYSVTYAVNGSVVDTSTYFMSVDDETQVSGKDCYHVDMSVQNAVVGKTGAERVARSAAGMVNTSVIGGEMWYLKDTFDLAKKKPVSLAYGNETYTTLTYTYNGSHGAPWEAGKTWTFSTNVSATTGVTWQVASSAKVAAEEDITVPAGTFKCYRIEYTAAGSTQPNLIEWWSEDVGMFVKLVDYGNYAGIETRVLISKTLGK